MDGIKPIPAGYCQCGCGQRTSIATRNRRQLGHIKGQPLPYVLGHNKPKGCIAEPRGDHYVVPLHNRAGEVVAEVLVSPQDVARIVRNRWCLTSDGYARRNKRGYWARLHREIFGLAPRAPQHVDHINGDRLDNRRENLRLVTQAQQAQNVPSHRDAQSPYRGVHWSKAARKWAAEACIAGQKYWLGLHGNEQEAAEAVARFRVENMTHTVER